MTKLHLGVTDTPSLKAALSFGFQQSMLCMSSLLVYPFIVADLACAGSYVVNLRLQLIAATFVASGLATIIQTTFGLRLSILNGPAMAFWPPLVAYQQQNICPYGIEDDVPLEFWQGRLREISGSLMLACTVFVILGVTGLAGIFARLIGPVTVVPLMLLLTTSIIPTIEEKMALHWISIVTLIVVVTMAIYLENVRIPIPYYSFEKKSKMVMRVRIFGQFPYLITILFCWFLCFVLTITNIEQPGGNARTDSNTSISVLTQSPWIQVPLPGRFGSPTLNTGLCLAYLASCLASVIENIGSYDLLARTSNQRPPPKDAINRAIIAEGVGSIIAGYLGVCAGVTTYAENIALIHITKVASRWVMQIAGLMLITMGVLTKMAALLATIPNALIGGILAMGTSMIGGVALSNLKLVDLHLTRNLAIMGLSFVIGLVVPTHFELHPVDTGNVNIDNILNMLLSIRMLIGGLLATFLDNTVPGATRAQRGFVDLNDKCFDFMDEPDGYALPKFVEKILREFPSMQSLPFLPKIENRKIETSSL